MPPLLYKICFSMYCPTDTPALFACSLSLVIATSLILAYNTPLFFRRLPAPSRLPPCVYSIFSVILLLTFLINVFLVVDGFL